MFNLGEAILALLEIVFGFWNNQVSLVFELLGQSPTGFKGGGPWGIIEGIEPLFVGIGSALVVLFFVIGFCAESVDIREEIRFEAILRMFIRVAIAQWLVSYNITIMKALFTSCGNLVGHLGQRFGIWNQYRVPDTCCFPVFNRYYLWFLPAVQCLFPLFENYGNCTFWGDCQQYPGWKPGA